jgi:hypothetical protein
MMNGSGDKRKLRHLADRSDSELMTGSSLQLASREESRCQLVAHAGRWMAASRHRKRTAFKGLANWASSASPIALNRRPSALTISSSRRAQG